MILAFRMLALILVGLAGYFLWADNNDWAFGCFVLGVCSYFLGMRFQLKARLAGKEAAEQPSAGSDRA